MKKIVTFAAAVVMLASVRMAAADVLPINGQVTKIDVKQSKITLRHGPIKKLDMDMGMTMVFRVKDPALLTPEFRMLGIKPGHRTGEMIPVLNGGEQNMIRFVAVLALASVLAPSAGLAQSQRQPYAGYQQRSIKALSDAQIGEL